MSELPNLSEKHVNLEDLKSGVKYYFKVDSHPGNLLEGIFYEHKKYDNGIISYIFKNVIILQKQGDEYIKIVELPQAIFDDNLRSNGSRNVPEDIITYESEKLPNVLDNYIGSFGGKSRKTKRRRNKKFTCRYKKNKSTLLQKNKSTRRRN